MKESTESSQINCWRASQYEPNSMYYMKMRPTQRVSQTRNMELRNLRSCELYMAAADVPKF